jgi:hypothetical protein
MRQHHVSAALVQFPEEKSINGGFRVCGDRSRLRRKVTRKTLRVDRQPEHHAQRHSCQAGKPTSRPVKRFCMARQAFLRAGSRDGR